MDSYWSHPPQPAPNQPAFRPFPPHPPTNQSSFHSFPPQPPAPNQPAFRPFPPHPPTNQSSFHSFPPQPPAPNQWSFPPQPPLPNQGFRGPNISHHQQPPQPSFPQNFNHGNPNSTHHGHPNVFFKPSFPPPLAPPPSLPPPDSSVLPPLSPTAPPPSVPPPPPPPPKESRGGGGHRDTRRELDQGKHVHGHNKQQNIGPTAPSGRTGRPSHLPSGQAGRVETEEERRSRKKREYEKQKQEEKHRKLIKDTQNTVLHKTQMLASANKGHGSLVGSRLGDKRAPFLSGERTENRLKKLTTFLCKLKFRNELPDPTAQPKLMSPNTDKDRYAKYSITSLEKMHKPKLFVEPDLGIPLDLLDISVYNPPSGRPPLTPEDEELLRDDESATPVKQNGIRKKERPTDKGVSWLVKTQYISPLSLDAAKTSRSEKEAKEQRELKEGINSKKTREDHIKAIEASFEACKSVPVHATNSKLQPVEILPLLPDFERLNDRFVLASFDNDPTADSEIYGKLDKSVRDELESQAIMKSFVGTTSDPAKPDKFLAYMAPSPDELWKDIYDENEDISYNWIREYHYDVRGDDADDPTTYLVTFGDEGARYLPLPTKLVLRKKRATDGRSTEEFEHYPVPSRVTVRRAVEVEESGGDTRASKMRRLSAEDTHESRQKAQWEQETDHYSGAEDDISE